MFHLFRRINRLLRFPFMGSGDDPEKMLEQYLLEMKQRIAEAENTLTKLLAEQKRFVKQIEGAEQKLDRRKQQAVEALSSGKEDFAQTVLEDKALLHREILHLQGLHENTTAQLQELKEKLQKMKASYQQLSFKADAFTSKALLVQRSELLQGPFQPKQLDWVENNTNHATSPFKGRLQEDHRPGFDTGLVADQAELRKEAAKELQQLKEMIKQKK
ncbi:phage shock protein A [Evansella caseinilytica]|uniref:Phage shock protein A n=1 Tax=Evansella caseinilytica TaxID=1503961 RepID=A0A1H3IZ99_9BACI|nr:PspA/IM30 family protein [Evansella caseinilytica]SDY33050.1 phage shock protein A [Evansella caseinilytica]